VSASHAQQQWNTHASGRRLPDKATDTERLKILRLDLHTLREAVQFLNQELDDDFTSTIDTVMIMDHIDELKHGLEHVRLNIKILKAAMKAA